MKFKPKCPLEVEVEAIRVVKEPSSSTGISFQQTNTATEIHPS